MSPNIGKWIYTTALFTAAAISSASLVTPVVHAEDLSAYRDFRLGMDLKAVEKQAEMKASEVKTIHRRPAVIQDLEWRPRSFSTRFPEADPVKDALLSFYNGQLFRIVVNYDRYRTEGMTADDMIDAISATYGAGAKPAAEILFPSSYSEMVKVIARWEDSEYSVDLVYSPYQPSFALVSFSKQLAALAQAATVEAARLDLQEAPQREAEQTRRQADEMSAKQEKARMVNKPSFRP